MLSVVLRLRSDELLQGHLAGEAEVVESRRRGVIRSADELIEFVAGECDPDADSARDGRPA